MVKEVIKKDGTKAPFEVEKIKGAIAAAAQQAGLTEERKNEVVGQATTAVMQGLEGKDETTAEEIKNSVLKELDSIEPSVSAAWRKYDQENKKT